MTANGNALGKAGGVYIPPFKLAQLQKDINDKHSVEYQRMTWEALKKSINGIVNKVSPSNIKNLIPELFYENLVRGRGLFCRSLMKAQAASPNFTAVYAALVAVVNTKMPEIGELLVKRLIVQFRRAYQRNNKILCLSSTQFIAQLVNQQVVGVLLPLELCQLLLERLTDDSVEVAVSFVTECGALLQELTPQGFHGIFDRLRGILHEGDIDKRVQYTVEMLFAVRKSNFAEHPAIRPELDLVDANDQVTHEDLSLDDPSIDPEDRLNFFHMDEHYVENEEKYELLRREILGDEIVDSLEGREDSNGNPTEDAEAEESNAEEDANGENGAEQEALTDSNRNKLNDTTDADLVSLRRTIYLTIMSSIDFNECAHKLMKIKWKPGQEIELCNMLIECCSQERTYMRFYGLLGQRFCMLDNVYQENFDHCFVGQYTTIHRLETNKLRNVSKFFAHLLHTDALPWTVLSYIHLNEQETTSSSRIFIKILFQELAEYLGLQKLNERFKDPFMQQSFEGIFPKDNPKNTRFAINFFTSIGLGGLTEDLRDHLRNAPKRIMEQQAQVSDESESEESSSSDESESESEESSSSDESESESTSTTSSSDSESSE